MLFVIVINSYSVFCIMIIDSIIDIKCRKAFYRKMAKLPLL